jgi:hypothetical protein
MPDEYWANALFSLVPSVAVGLVFLVVIRGILGADRNERKVYDTVLREELNRMAEQDSASKNGTARPAE